MDDKTKQLLIQSIEENFIRCIEEGLNQGLHLQEITAVIRSRLINKVSTLQYQDVIL